jgi:hypothetical protein
MRSCREQLAKHAERRRMRRRKQWAAAQAAADGGGGNGGDEAISEGGAPAGDCLSACRTVWLNVFCAVCVFVTSKFVFQTSNAIWAWV